MPCGRLNPSGKNVRQHSKTTRQPYLRQTLNQLVNQISRKVNGLDRRHSLRLNMTMWSAGAKHIDVWLKWNTPEIRRLFCTTILDSPAVTFHGPRTLETDSTVGVGEVDSVALWPEYPVYSTWTDSVNIQLTNCSNGRIVYGKWRLVYEDDEGDWRQMPSTLTTIHYDEEYAWFHDKNYICPRTTKFLTVWLMPTFYHHSPGRCRFLQDVRIGEKKDTLLMTEFRLSDKGREWKDITKTTVPPTVLAIDSAAVLAALGTGYNTGLAG